MVLLVELDHALDLGVAACWVHDHGRQDASGELPLCRRHPVGVGRLHDAHHRRRDTCGLEEREQLFGRLDDLAPLDTFEEVAKAGAAVRAQERGVHQRVYGPDPSLGPTSVIQLPHCDRCHVRRPVVTFRHPFTR